LAKRITDSLDPPIDYDKEGRIMTPDVDGMRLFERIFKATCSSPLNPVNDRAVFNKGWSSIGKDGQTKWYNARSKFAELHKACLDNNGGKHFWTALFILFVA
jgi:hypothetical protein